MIAMNGPIKQSVEALCAKQPEIYVFLMGGRRTDPGRKIESIIVNS